MTAADVLLLYAGMAVIAAILAFIASTLQTALKRAADALDVLADKARRP